MSLVLPRSWLRVILQMQKCSQIWTATRMRSSNLQWHSITTHQRCMSMYTRYWNCSTHQEFGTGLHLWTASPEYLTDVIANYICGIWCMSHDLTGEKSLWWFQNHSITEWWEDKADPMVLLEDLNAVQEMLGFSFANKLKKKHITWQKHKMHVNLSVQTLSNSVADATDFLFDEFAHSKLQGSEATTEFIRKIDVMFDLLNSKNSFLKETKAPVTLSNFSWWSQTCDKTCAYLLSLRDYQEKLALLWKT